MTPTEQDKELREAILLEFKNVHRLAPADYTENCTNIVMELITAYTNKQVKAKLAHISEYAENVISIDENGEFSMKAIPLSLVAVERTKLKESK